MSTLPENRRGFLSAVTTLLMGVLAACLAAPALGYFWGPLWKRRGKAGEESLRDVGALQDFPIGEWRLVNLELVHANGWEKSGVRRHSIWICRRSEADGGITVLSPICPHLGCPVHWHAEQKHFLCPCHGGIFDDKGQTVSGPPPRGMDPLQYEVRAGRLLVRWQDFKVGVRERVPVKV
ncbi:MAG TPA: ubiquinol-cytochrome c reductase iron-sulfur subunit [Gemmataceae bacterium]|jgi:Rieske Fe-S protein|nr:ubiquinol-cytochrome c reductase iron-sulfur subunit [Gemmataceae bacterium]